MDIQVKNTAFGDMNGDGTVDAVVLLAVNAGGTGTFHELAVLLNRDGKPVYAATKRGLGDRNNIKALTVSGRTAILDMKVQGPGDAMCCPTKKVKLKFRLRQRGKTGFQLVQVR